MQSAPANRWQETKLQSQLEKSCLQETARQAANHGLKEYKIWLNTKLKCFLFALVHFNNIDSSGLPTVVGSKGSTMNSILKNSTGDSGLFKDEVLQQIEPTKHVSPKIYQY